MKLFLSTNSYVEKSVKSILKNLVCLAATADIKLDLRRCEVAAYVNVGGFGVSVEIDFDDYYGGGLVSLSLECPAAYKQFSFNVCWKGQLDREVEDESKV